MTNNLSFTCHGAMRFKFEGTITEWSLVNVDKMIGGIESRGGRGLTVKCRGREARSKWLEGRRIDSND